MPAFEVYKPDLATRSRWMLGISAGALGLYAGYELYVSLPSWMRGHMFGGFRPLGEEFPVSWAILLAAVVAAAGLIGTWIAVNHPRLVEFFAETEIEMGKVSWSSKNEVVGSSIVVIATVVILGTWIYLVDVLLALPWGTWVSGTFGRLLGGGGGA